MPEVYSYGLQTACGTAASHNDAWAEELGQHADVLHIILVSAYLGLVVRRKMSQQHFIHCCRCTAARV